MRIANFDFCMALSIQSKKRNTINVKLERSENTSSINLYVVVLWPNDKPNVAHVTTDREVVSLTFQETRTKLSSHTTYSRTFRISWISFTLNTPTHNLKFIMLHWAHF